MKPLLLFLLMISSPLATPSQSGEGELCDICIDLVKISLPLKSSFCIFFEKNTKGQSPEKKK